MGLQVFSQQAPAQRRTEAKRRGLQMGLQVFSQQTPAQRSMPWVTRYTAAGRQSLLRGFSSRQGLLPVVWRRRRRSLPDHRQTMPPGRQFMFHLHVPRSVSLQRGGVYRSRQNERNIAMPQQSPAHKLF